MMLLLYAIGSFLPPILLLCISDVFPAQLLFDLVYHCKGVTCVTS